MPGYTNAAYYCPNRELYLLHTHEGSGTIHVELPVIVSISPTQVQFFEIWGPPLTSAQAWTFVGRVKAAMMDMDTSRTTDYSFSPGNIPFYEPAAEPNGGVYAIPQSLIFNGACGSGQSGGSFIGGVI